MKEIYEKLKELKDTTMLDKPTVLDENSSAEISETIRHEKGKWILYTKDGSRVLGEHDTKEEAIAQERAIEISKHSH